ncbi:Ig-like domain-containing protein [Shewanella surugensis]|uniref:Uncharacterized protein n=1 Tax=Shewanella surugensis TaxID=212020 RepID=A0ABT0L5H1_9GAMM|nr:cadherin-like domain-containing protein [Shewanella surugensis]MCL1122932.1 hypothetical protein [Shewanella surugensis]
MINYYTKSQSPRLFALIAVLALSLTGCGSDNDSQTDRPDVIDNPVSDDTVSDDTVSDDTVSDDTVSDDTGSKGSDDIRLTALPYIVTAKQGDILYLDLTQILMDNNINDWQLIELEDKAMLGVLSKQTDMTFDYHTNAAGVGTINYTVSANGVTVSSYIAIAVSGTAPNNNPPVAAHINLEAWGDDVISTDLRDYISDSDDDTLTILGLMADSEGFALLGNGEQVTFTAEGFIGREQAIYSIEDGRGGYALGYITVISSDMSPLEPNIVPTAQDYAHVISGGKEASWEIDLSALKLINDADGDELSLSHLYTANERATIVGDTLIHYSPDDIQGIDYFIYVISDGKGGEAQGKVTIEVSPVLAEITDITIETLADGSLAAKVTCPSCLTEDYAYTWIVNDLTVSTEAVYMPHASDAAHYIRLEVAVVGDQAQVVPSQHVVYGPTEVVIYANYGAYAALKADATVVTWGEMDTGGDSSSVASELTDVTAIESTTYALAALREDGTVVTWGDMDTGGDSSAVADKLVNVKALYANNAAFVALKDDASAVAWGRSESGGDTSAITDKLVNIKHIYSTGEAFAALKADGTVVTWGAVDSGGDSLNVAPDLTDVQVIYATNNAFIAVKGDGSVVAWPESNISSSIESQLMGVKAVYSTNDAFAALKQDGAVITWGNDDNGGDSSSVASKLNDGVIAIYSNKAAFAALKQDGTAVSWGARVSGGNSSAVMGLLNNIKGIYSYDNHFVALKEDNSVMLWGNPDELGNNVAQVAVNVKAVYSNRLAFVAVKYDGSVVTWGDPNYGGDISDVAGTLFNVKKVYSTNYSFAAVREDGQVIVWGQSNAGGDASAVADALLPTPFKSLIETSITP